jgi:excisionase family DNA binding protein
MRLCVFMSGENSLPKSSTTLAPVEGGLIDKLEHSDRNLIVREVADIFRVTPGTVYRLARKHAIPSFRFGGSLLFNPQKLAQWMRGAEGSR